MSQAEAIGRIVGYFSALCCFPVLVVLFVGVLRLLIVRPRISFRQAVFRWWVLLIGGAFFVLALLGMLGNAIQKLNLPR